MADQATPVVHGNPLPRALTILLGLAAAVVHLPIHERRAPRLAPVPA